MIYLTFSSEKIIDIWGNLNGCDKKNAEARKYITEITGASGRNSHMLSALKAAIMNNINDLDEKEQTELKKIMKVIDAVSDEIETNGLTRLKSDIPSWLDLFLDKSVLDTDSADMQSLEFNAKVLGICSNLIKNLLPMPFDYRPVQMHAVDHIKACGTFKQISKPNKVTSRLQLIANAPEFGFIYLYNNESVQKFLANSSNFAQKCAVYYNEFKGLNISDILFVHPSKYTFMKKGGKTFCTIKETDVEFEVTTLIASCGKINCVMDGTSYMVLVP